MLYVIGSLLFAVIAILVKGLMHLSLAEFFVVFAIPVLFIYKLLGNRPSFFAYMAMLAGFAGGISAFVGYVVVPIQYYYELWGWIGIAGGVIAAILLPWQLIAFLIVAYLKGGAATYMGDFFSGILFGIAGLLLYFSRGTGPIRTRIFQRCNPQDEV